MAEAAVGAVGKQRAHRLGPRGVIRELARNRALYLLVLPAVLYTFVYGYITLPYMAIAFEKFNFRTGILSQWVGLKNFQYFFKSTWAATVTRNTLILNFLFIVIVYVSSIVLALLLNEVRAKRFLKVSQTVMLFPYFISWVVVSYMLQGLLNTSTGLLNRIIAGLGGEAVSFYSTPGYWYVILILLRVWKYIGWTSVIYLSVITGIDGSLFEAAYIDGAGRLQSVLYITLPLLLPTASILTLMEVGRIFYGDFSMFYAIIRDNGSLMPVAEVIDTYVYRTFKLTGNPSLSMAVGMYQSLVGFALVFGSNALVNKLYPEGALF
ncbi:MAG: ABC transporter permease subunit [Oscillospiraceae bacterium]|nr:ABC transporter permease subunit [Oscillospiraceae bacterium]